MIKTTTHFVNDHLNIRITTESEAIKATKYEKVAKQYMKHTNHTANKTPTNQSTYYPLQNNALISPHAPAATKPNTKILRKLFHCFTGNTH